MGEDGNHNCGVSADEEGSIVKAVRHGVVPRIGDGRLTISISVVSLLQSAANRVIVPILQKAFCIVDIQSWPIPAVSHSVIHTFSLICYRRHPYHCKRGKYLFHFCDPMTFLE